jgi:hypothetical protein
MRNSIAILRRGNAINGKLTADFRMRRAMERIPDEASYPSWQGFGQIQKGIHHLRPNLGTLRRLGVVSVGCIHSPRYCKCVVKGGNYLQICEEKAQSWGFEWGRETRVGEVHASFRGGVLASSGLQIGPAGTALTPRQFLPTW